MIIDDDKVQELVYALDLDEESVYARYSGRSMYGRECFGLVIDVPDVLVGVALRDVFDEDAWDMARAARTDSMGMSVIVYFPGWELAEDTKFAEPRDSDEN